MLFSVRDDSALIPMTMCSVDTFLVDESVILIGGWTYCEEQKTLFDNLYLVVGDRLLTVPYGGDRSDVAGVFGMDEIKDCGFTLQYSSAFTKEELSDVRLIGVIGEDIYVQYIYQELL